MHLSKPADLLSIACIAGQLHSEQSNGFHSPAPDRLADEICSCLYTCMTTNGLPDSRLQQESGTIKLLHSGQAKARKCTATYSIMTGISRKSSPNAHDNAASLGKRYNDSRASTDARPRPASSEYMQPCTCTREPSGSSS